MFGIITEEDINDLFKEEDPEPDPDPGDDPEPEPDPEPSRPENNSEHTGSGKGTFGGAEEVAYNEWSIDVNYLGYSTQDKPGGINGECEVRESPKANGEYDSDEYIDFPLIFSTAGKILSISVTVSNLTNPSSIFNNFIFESDFGGYIVTIDGYTWTLEVGDMNQASNYITINYDGSGGFIRNNRIKSIIVKTIQI